MVTSESQERCGKSMWENRILYREEHVAPELQREF